MTQGQSAATEAKLRGVSSLIGINLRMAGPPIRRFVAKGWSVRYHHFDLHAGTGINDQLDRPIIGSPLAALHAMRQSGLPYAFVGIDIDPEKTKELARRIRPDPNAFVMTGHNSELCEAIPEIIRKRGENPSKALGSVFIDPNASPYAVRRDPSSGDATPYEAIIELTRKCPCLDLMINYPANGVWKRQRENSHIRERLIALPEFPNAFNKKNWLVRESIGSQQWVLCMGRNARGNDYKREGFVHWDSEQGKDIIARAHMTRDEYASYAGTRQMTLL